MRKSGRRTTTSQSVSQSAERATQRDAGGAFLWRELLCPLDQLSRVGVCVSISGTAHRPAVSNMAATESPGSRKRSYIGNRVAFKPGQDASESADGKIAHEGITRTRNTLRRVSRRDVHRYGFTPRDDHKGSRTRGAFCRQAPAEGIRSDATRAGRCEGAGLGSRRSLIQASSPASATSTPR